MSEFFAFLNDLSYGKEMILTDENERAYTPFIINEIYSRFVDGITPADTLNKMPDLPKRMHYLYMMNSLSKRKRFAKMPKPELPEHFDVIQDYYKYNTTRTKEVFDILTPEQINSIVKMCDKGGVK